MDPHAKYKPLTFAVVPPNDSGIPIDEDKAKAWPAWAAEADIRPRMRATNMGEVEVTRTYRCPYDRVHEFREYMLGWVHSFVERPDLIKARVVFTREIPAQDPQAPYLYASEFALVDAAGKAVRRRFLANGAEVNLAIAGIGGLADQKYLGYDATVFIQDAGGSKVDEGIATVEVTFRALRYIVRSDKEADKVAIEAIDGFPGVKPMKEMTRWVSWEETYELQALPLAKIVDDAKKLNSPLTLQFIEGPYQNRPVPEAGVLLIPTTRLVVTWHQVPFPPRDAIAAVVGTINAEQWGALRGFRTYPKETMLCQPPQVKEMGRTVRGQKLFDIIYTFSIREQTWNAFPGPDAVYKRAAFVTAAGAISSYVYQTGDFTKLFTPPTPVIYQ